MTSLGALMKWFYARVDGATTLPVWRSLPPVESEYPLVRIDAVDSQRHHMGGLSVGDEFLIQVRAIGGAGGEMDAAMEPIDAALVGARGTGDGYEFDVEGLSMDSEAYEDDGVRRVGVTATYNVWVRRLAA